MKLAEILNGIKIIDTKGSDNLHKEISGISFDSRTVDSDYVFIAIKGDKTDGHKYIPLLSDKKPAAIVVEEMPANIDDFENTCFINVADTHEALGIIASNYYNTPSNQLKLIGVTGTNGKTTIATLIYEMCRKAGLKAGLLSTVANYIDGVRYDATHTTPDPVSLNALLRKMADEGCKIVAMEVSSHAAHQKRIAGLKFAGGIFTNLTRDHLDYHQTFANYRDAKKLFFDSLPQDAFALVNIDDRNGEFMLQNTKAVRKTYALLNKADFKARIIEKHINGTLMSINGEEFETQFAGVYNAYNLTAVYGAMILLGFDPYETLVDLSSMHPVQGRFQTLMSPDEITAVVDYAHTPDALNNVLEAINEVKSKKQHVITVVGCGGNRDRGKRPQMASIAVSNSWKTILTSDNPRNEDPMDILNDMRAGVDKDKENSVIVNPDRREAIKTAFALAAPGDIILVAGKGHEDYQEIKGIKHHFSDTEEIERIINK